MLIMKAPITLNVPFHVCALFSGSSADRLVSQVNTTLDMCGGAAPVTAEVTFWKG